MPPIVAGAESASREILVRLLDGSLQGALVVAVVWAVCAACKSVPASVRTWLWWLACLKLVLALVAFPAVPVPVLPSTPHGAARTAGERVVDTAALALPVETIKKLPRAVLPDEATRVAQSLGWRSSALLLGMALVALWWVTVLAVQGLVLMATHRHLRALAARARPADEHCLRETRWLARLLELRRVPEVLLSDEVTSPQVIGFWRPRVLLPATTSSFSEDERRMMLCHELTHVRRRDLVLGWIPALAERSFFFHPLARLAAREYVLAREAACDATVLRALSAEPQTYARLLIRLGVSRHVPALSAAGSSSTVSMLKRRLEMLHITASAPARSRRLWLLAVTLALAAVPFQLTARASFLPAPLTARQTMPVAAPTVVPAAPPPVWIVQLFGVPHDVARENRRSPGIAPVIDRPAPSGSLPAVRFGARRGPAGNAVAVSTAHAEASSPGQGDTAVQTQLEEHIERALRQPVAAEVEKLLREADEALKQLQRNEGETGLPVREAMEALMRQHQAAAGELARAERELSQAPDEASRRLRELAEGMAYGFRRPQSTETIELLMRQIDERLRAVRERLNANHPERVVTERLVEQLKRQSAQLETAKADLDRHGLLMEQARARLAELERQLRETASKALGEAGKPAPVAPESSAK